MRVLTLERCAYKYEEERYHEQFLVKGKADVPAQLCLAHAWAEGVGQAAGEPACQLLDEQDVHQLGVAVAGRGEGRSLAVETARVEQVFHVVARHLT